MLSELLQYINKWYVKTLEVQTFTIVPDGIEFAFNETYLVGQYISIDNSVLNDGVYKITALTSTKITVADTLVAENTENVYLWGLAIPKDIVSLSITIEDYLIESNDGLASENQGGRSVSYAENSTWSSVFGSRLSKYRSIVSDKDIFAHYDINTKHYY